MEIVLRPHQVRDLIYVINHGIDNDFAETHGEPALRRLEEIIAIVAADPEAAIRVGFIDLEHNKYASGLSVCGSECLNIKRIKENCQGPYAIDHERRFANQLGIKMGGVYPARELLKLAKNT